jgi:hypothetical protein
MKIRKPILYIKKQKKKSYSITGIFWENVYLETKFGTKLWEFEEKIRREVIHGRKKRKKYNLTGLFWGYII